jgi:hypothetical protein
MGDDSPRQKAWFPKWLLHLMKEDIDAERFAVLSQRRVSAKQIEYLSMAKDWFIQRYPPNRDSVAEASPSVSQLPSVLERYSIIDGTNTAVDDGEVCAEIVTHSDLVSSIADRNWTKEYKEEIYTAMVDCAEAHGPGI